VILISACLPACLHKMIIIIIIILPISELVCSFAIVHSHRSKSNSQRLLNQHSTTHEEPLTGIAESNLLKPKSLSYTVSYGPETFVVLFDSCSFHPSSWLVIPRCPSTKQIVPEISLHLLYYLVFSTVFLQSVLWPLIFWIPGNDE